MRDKREEQFYVGIDVGGTFTDCVVMDSEGASTLVKTFTSPTNPSDGVIAGLEKLGRILGLPLKDFLGRVIRIVHGTTITTNAVLTARGAKTGFITTKGFRDILLMRRGIREDQYNSKQSPPAPLSPRSLTFPVAERIDCEGHETQPMDREGARAAVVSLRKAGVESIAVSFLFSFLNFRHEQEVAQIISEEFPEAYVSLSSEVLPQLRAYERYSTTVLNAYVGPVLTRYLKELTNKLIGVGFHGQLLIMQSNGGVMAPEIASRFACRTLLSGPAGGPVAAVFYGERGAKTKDLILMDMGGTSFDVSLIKGGVPGFTTAGTIGGHAMAFPVLDIRTIGAGGGSIAWVDQGGGLHVGPDSAGANPGPVCYGQGGHEPTVTDADLVLGLIGEEDFLGGEFSLDFSSALKEIESSIAKPLGLDVSRAAEGIHELVNSMMADAIRLVSISRGHDPRQCSLVVAGGAGPVHAAAIARDLGITHLLVPRQSSVLCAVGMILCDLKHDCVKAFSGELSKLSRAGVGAVLQEMEADASATLRYEGLPAEDVVFSYAADLRYVGQFHEITVPFESLIDGFAILETTFHYEHNKLYGYSLPGEPVEALHWRLTAVGATKKPLHFGRGALSTAQGSTKKDREVVFESKKLKIPVYRANELSPGIQMQGPAILEEPTTTIVIPPDWNLWLNENQDYEITMRR